MTALRPDREPPYVEMRAVRYDTFVRGCEGGRLTQMIGWQDRMSDDETPIYDWRPLVTPEALERFKETTE